MKFIIFISILITFLQLCSCLSYNSAVIECKKGSSGKQVIRDVEKRGTYQIYTNGNGNVDDGYCIGKYQKIPLL